ncbi:Tyrosine-protein kinase receptor UFO [Geodia barretti]|uniref:Tyrosine-protein kinase receptor UFO n=1 Tax=Geodia barretti TaxID=519541 RepID=A0AA35WGY3_GEOBA|nr:Tyrosine-protein kinase receptor UFO [Geodia barretti]
MLQFIRCIFHISKGESGQVYKGYLNTALGKELVAVKTGKALCSASDAERLVKEVSTMLLFKHTNVMSLVGVCLNGDIPLLIMPFMSNGNVLEFVKHHREELLCIDAIEIQVVSARKTLLKISHQISKGMEYLALEKFVHRDLAARNCMIDRDGVIKVADFGLTEDMYGTNYFRREKGEGGSEEKVPIRWMAPESIEEDIYTEATDVWSFGVTVWEIFTCGRIPYTGIPAMFILKELQAGQRLERPDNEACLGEVYEIMMSCWSLDCHARPLFKDLVGRLSDLLERESDYLELSAQSLCWKETVSHTPPPSSPPTEQETAITEEEPI